MKILVIISLIVSSWGNATSLYLAVPGLAESAMPEDVFVESIAPLVFSKFRFFVCNIVRGWNHANEQSDWGSLLLYLRHETCQLNKQLADSRDDWGLRKIAESIDPNWA